MSKTKLKFKTRRATHEDKKVLSFLGDASQPQLTKGDTAFLAVEESGNAIGYIAGHRVDGGYVINQLHVVSWHRRQGVATALLKHYTIFLRFQLFGGNINPVFVDVHVPRGLDSLATGLLLNKVKFERPAGMVDSDVHVYNRIMEFGMMDKEGWSLD